MSVKTLQDRTRYPKDLTGLRFGRLTVIDGPFPHKNGTKTQYCWLCRCDCGKTRTFLRSSLIGGGVKSCGCLRTETQTRAKEAEGLARCHQCAYSFRPDRRSYDVYCNYCGTTGHKRPCSPGASCTVYKSRDSFKQDAE